MIQKIKCLFGFHDPLKDKNGEKVEGPFVYHDYNSVCTYMRYIYVYYQCTRCKKFYKRFKEKTTGTLNKRI